MPRTCTVCRHSQREQIEKDLLSGDSYRNIADRFGTSKTALVRHKGEHLPKELVKARDEQGVLRSERLLDSIHNQEDRAESLYVAAETILKRALAVKDLRTAIQSIRAAVDVMGEARAYLELRGTLSGELGARAAQQVSIGKIQVLAMPKCPGVSSGKCAAKLSETADSEPWRR
jgi:hypothetical protein